MNSNDSPHPEQNPTSPPPWANSPRGFTRWLQLVTTPAAWEPERAELGADLDYVEVTVQEPTPWGWLIWRLERGLLPSRSRALAGTVSESDCNPDAVLAVEAWVAEPSARGFHRWRAKDAAHPLRVAMGAGARGRNPKIDAITHALGTVAGIAATTTAFPAIGPSALAVGAVTGCGVAGAWIWGRRRAPVRQITIGPELIVLAEISQLAETAAAHPEIGDLLRSTVHEVIWTHAGKLDQIADALGWLHDAVQAVKQAQHALTVTTLSHRELPPKPTVSQSAEQTIPLVPVTTAQQEHYRTHLDVQQVTDRLLAYASGMWDMARINSSHRN